MPAFLFKPTPHDQASQWIAQKPILAREAFDHLLPDLKARAFTITGVEAANTMQNVRDRIAELPLGASWDKVKADVAAAISPWLDQGTTDQETKGPSPSERRAELLLRTHGFAAYDAAATDVLYRQRAAFPSWQYFTAHDDRVRESHAELDGLVFPADSPFWDRQRDWGCRCSKVGLTSEDVADIEKEDAKKIPEAQRVISGDRLRRVETSNQLTVAGPGGMPRFVDVSTRGPSKWNDRTVQIDVAQLRTRYDQETWNVFETWAGLQQLGEGHGTVLDWLRKTPPLDRRGHTFAEPLPPAAGPGPSHEGEPRPAGQPDRLPAGAAQAGPPPRISPVSAALEIRTSGPHKPQIEAAIRAVDRVHDDGTLPAVPIIGQVGDKSAMGRLVIGPDGQPVQIEVGNPRGGWAALNTVHEIGHLLDQQVLGKRGAHASGTHPALAGFRAAALQTKAVAAIAALPTRGQLLQVEELWSRAYAQYIAIRSRDPLLLAQLDRIRRGREPWRQWSDEDFAPIAAAIDHLFREKGWIK